MWFSRRIILSLCAVSVVFPAMILGDLALAKEKAAKSEAPAQASAPSSMAEMAGSMNQPVIKVNDMVISFSDFMGFLQSHPQIISRATRSEEGKAEAYRELVTVFLLQQSMIDEELLKKGKEPPTQQEVIKAYEALAQKHFPLPPIPDEAVAYAYYQAHPNDFGIPPMIRVNQVLFKVPPKSDAAVDAAAKERAVAALGRISKGEKFSVVASQLTEDPIGKIANGDMGFIDLERDAWLKDAIKDRKVGDHTDILKAPNGYAILEVSDIRPGLTSPYPNVRDKVIKILRDVKQRELRDPYVKGLSKKAKIDILDPDVKALFPNGVFPD